MDVLAIAVARFLERRFYHDRWRRDAPSIRCFTIAFLEWSAARRFPSGKWTRSNRSNCSLPSNDPRSYTLVILSCEKYTDSKRVREFGKSAKNASEDHAFPLGFPGIRFGKDKKETFYKIALLFSPFFNSSFFFFTLIQFSFCKREPSKNCRALFKHVSRK